ncbi:hypothetical protein DASB73_012560 [Starmerella bacillaris]|uniref:Uncharacterized protein n=1 Tax=Starmerella bacillaris TaxID=1247836 RepID=A0AAV5RFT0_STABA|nr:hypothetical protein DASB73_012560 [Starmerella bacillaris]
MSRTPPQQTTPEPSVGDVPTLYGMGAPIEEPESPLQLRSQKRKQQKSNNPSNGDSSNKTNHS